uniref:Homeobox protein MOX-1 n=1 Tax=Sus scrofa TaxID=9823 RepID=A0A4X1TNF2_PIG
MDPVASSCMRGPHPQPRSGAAFETPTQKAAGPQGSPTTRRPRSPSTRNQTSQRQRRQRTLTSRPPAWRPPRTACPRRSASSLSSTPPSHNPLTGPSLSRRPGGGSTQARRGAPRRWGPAAQAWWTPRVARARTTRSLGAVPMRRRRSQPDGKRRVQVKVWFQNRRMKWKRVKGGQPISPQGQDPEDGDSATSPSSE